MIVKIASTMRCFYCGQGGNAALRAITGIRGTFMEDQRCWYDEQLLICIVHGEHKCNVVLHAKNDER